MELPDMFSKAGFLIEILNTLGLGILAAGVIVYYRALLSRSDNLKNSFNDLKEAHDKVVQVMERRAKEIDERFEDEKKFRHLHMSLLEDVEIYRVKVSAWRNDELTILQNKLKEMTERLDTVEKEYAKLKFENHELKIALSHLEDKYQTLEAQEKLPMGVRGLS